MNNNDISNSSYDYLDIDEKLDERSIEYTFTNPSTNCNSNSDKVISSSPQNKIIFLIIKKENKSELNEENKHKEKNKKGGKKSEKKNGKYTNKKLAKRVKNNLKILVLREINQKIKESEEFRDRQPLKLDKNFFEINNITANIQLFSSKLKNILISASLNEEDKKLILDIISSGNNDIKEILDKTFLDCLKDFKNEVISMMEKRSHNNGPDHSTSNYNKDDKKKYENICSEFVNNFETNYMLRKKRKEKYYKTFNLVKC